MFFLFGQNNPGGSFIGPARYVIVEAANAKMANAIAEDEGIYFDGMDAGVDCKCCGDRWCRASGEGDAVPLVYGNAEGEYESYFRPESISVVFADGTRKERTTEVKK